MEESSKTRKIRDPEFYTRYFAGRVIDIGCGGDLVVSHAEPFDVQHGDANDILKFRESKSYDTVNSSHCLEHMSDVPKALAGWWDLVKPGGFLVIVVPDEDLYEQGFWPSLFSNEHKATFRIGGSTSWSPVSYDIRALMELLPNSEVLSVKQQSNGYIHTLRLHGGKDMPKLRWFIRGCLKALKKRGLPVSSWLEILAYGIGTRLGCPFDQTDFLSNHRAVAQIEVIVRKQMNDLMTDEAVPLLQSVAQG